MDLRENVLKTLKNDNPKAFINEWEPFRQVMDPILLKIFNATPGKYIKDYWGVTVYWGENEPGPMPIINDETKVCPNVTEWRKYVKAPNIANYEYDWDPVKVESRKIHEEGKYVMPLMATGLFEQCHYLMGFEDTLVNLLIEPESMHELIEYITEYKLIYLKLLIDNLQPNVILFHDDWGSKRSLFMNPETWREFFKEPYRRIYGLMKENNIIVMHHADSFCQSIVKDMVDIGIDIWQGVLPENDIQQIKKDTDYKLTLMGGIDASVVDKLDIEEEVVRKEVQRACEEYSEGGMYIPCLTYGGEGSIYPGVNDIIMDEINKLNDKYFSNEIKCK